MSVPLKICTDASFALAAVLQDDHNHAAALKLLAELSAQNALLCAPALFVYECDSVIRLRVHQHKMTDEEAEEARALIDALQVEIEFDRADRERAFEIATIYDQPRAYDAAYAAHAQARDLDLITADRPFFEALNGDKLPEGAPALSFVTLLN